MPGFDVKGAVASQRSLAQPVTGSIAATGCWRANRMRLSRGSMSGSGNPILDRTDEWFVPRFGPRRFRVFMGLLFLPYTAMVLCFTILGALLAPQVDWHRVVALIVVYALALGIAAHALDALGKGPAKPWGSVFRAHTLKAIATTALVAAYA